MIASKALRPWLGIISLALFACAFWPHAGAQEGSRVAHLSAAERRQLEHGELIVHPSTLHRGSREFFGGNSWQVVDQPAEVTWQALCDADNYTRFLPAAQEARVIARSGDEQVMRVRHGAGIASARYHLRMRFDHSHRSLRFELDRRRPSDLRGAWGSASVRSFGGDPERSVVSWGAMADVGGGLLGGLLRGEVHQWMLRVPGEVRRYLHGSGRNRYSRPPMAHSHHR